jgi:lysophospholipase L1-like esterase
VKTLVVIGDSWTVGQGAEVVDLTKFNLQDFELVAAYKKFSYASVLSSNYLHGYTVINAADRGIGNRGAIKNLYLEDSNTLNQISEGYMIFLLSSWARFDYIHGNILKSRVGKMRSMRPSSIGKDNITDFYFEHIYHEDSATAETMLAIIEAQNFAKLHNLKFCFANSFDDRGMSEFEKIPNLLAQIDTSKFLNKYRPYRSFLDLLYQENDKQYMSECDHPNTAGQKLMAKEFFEFLSQVY